MSVEFRQAAEHRVRAAGDAVTTAYHEAAHAYLSWRLGHHVGGVELLPATAADDPRGTYHGYVLADVLAAPARARRRLARELCLVTLAGMIAERDLLGVQVDPLDTYEADRVETIMRRAGIGPRGGYVGDNAWESYKRRLEHEAAALVWEGRAKIVALADILTARLRRVAGPA